MKVGADKVEGHLFMEGGTHHHTITHGGKFFRMGSSEILSSTFWESSYGIIYPLSFYSSVF